MASNYINKFPTKQKNFQIKSLTTPVTNIYKITPIAHTSAFFASYGSPSKISGDTYAREPQYVLLKYSLHLSTSFEKPKSHNFILSK